MNDLLTSSSADAVCGTGQKVALQLLYDESFPYKSGRKKVIDLRKAYIDNEFRSNIKRKQRLQISCNLRTI